MGRPKLYTTEAERRAARLLAQQKYNAKRYTKVEEENFIDTPGLEIKQTKTRTIYKVDGKTVSANKVSKIIPTLSSQRSVKRDEITSLISKRAKQARKRMEYDIRAKRKTALEAEIALAKDLNKNARQSIRIYKNRLQGARLAIREIAEGSSLFTREQKDLMYKHAERFAQIAPEGERAGFWEIYDEVTGSDPRLGKQFIRTDAGVEKLKEMFEAQFGKNYTKTFLKFLY